jgi:hypothetical protein
MEEALADRSERLREHRAWVQAREEAIAEARKRAAASQLAD